jgi:serine-type D-Ala-D-Ala carboxypeptidase (penicillin-binding protein 5/6)
VDRAPARRRSTGRLALLAGLLAPLAVVAALVIARDGGAAREHAPPLAAAGPRGGAVADRGLPRPVEPPATPGAVDLGGVDAFALSFRKPPRAGLVFDLDSGEVLWRDEPTRTLPIASLTKIMTALLVAERTTGRERVLITRAALRYEGSGVGRLPRGRRVPIEALLHGLMLPSGNDAAIALAVHVAGSERRFVAEMNRRAAELRLTCTRFASSHGLEDGNRSCPADLAALSRIAMRQPRIARVARKRYAALRFPIKGRRLHLSSTNPLLRAGYPGTLGLKTGFTSAAGRCLVAVARRQGRTLAVVLLGSPDPGRQARRLLNEAFAAATG